MQDVLGVQELNGGNDLTHEVLSLFFAERPDLIVREGGGFGEEGSYLRVHC